MARPTTAWWPRWKPSKLPSATTAPVRLSGIPPARVRRCMADRLVGRKVLPQQPVLVNGKRDDEQVEDRKSDQRHIVGRAVAVELIADGRAEHREARRVGPKLFAQETVDDHCLHQSMAEQIKGIEAL